MGIKSKEARKYIFNCLDDMMQVRQYVLLMMDFFQHVTSVLYGFVHLCR